MARTIFAMMMVAAVGCGRAPQEQGVGTEKFALVLPNGGSLDAPPNQTTYVFFAAVGAGSDGATFSAENLPRFATLDGNKLTLAPVRADDGSYDVTVTATAGEQSDTAHVLVEVVAPNHAPGVMDALWMDVFQESPPGASGPVTTHWMAGEPCTLPMRLGGFHASDPDGDRVKIQVEVAAASDKLTGVPTQETGYRDYAIGGFSDWTDLLGVTAGVDFVVAIRAVDERGAAGPWLVLHPMSTNTRCNPAGAGLINSRSVPAGKTTTTELDFVGANGKPSTVSLVDGPAWATLSGTTLTVAPPAGTTGRFWATFRLTVDGQSYDHSSSINVY